MHTHLFNSIYYCSIIPLSLAKQRGRRLYKRYNLIFLFVDGDVCDWWESNRWESSCTRRSCLESELLAGTDLSQNSRFYVILKLPRDPYAMFIFHLSRLKPTHCLLFIGHGLHPRNTHSPLVTTYTLTFLGSGNHFVDFIYGKMYLSTTSAGSLPVKVIYYTTTPKFHSVTIVNNQKFI